MPPSPESPSLGAALRGDFKMLTRRANSPLHKWALALTNRGMQAVFLYRLSHALWRTGIPALPAILSRVAQHLYAVDLDYRAIIGPGLVIVHGFGIVVGNSVRIAGQCCLYHGVTLGNRGSEWVGSSRPDGQPTVGPGCMFGAGAKVLGPVTIGGNSVIGANAVVTGNLPENSIAAGIPATVVGTRPPMDENLRRLPDAPAPLPATTAPFHR